MRNLLYELVENLTLDDIDLLNMLTSNESLSRFSAKPRQEILSESKLTESSIRKSITRLEAMNFIKLSVENRKQVLYVTEYGQEAIQNIIERSNV